MSTQVVEETHLKGPNRDTGKLISFALKGDLSFRVIEHIETGDQAIVLTLPEAAASAMAYSLVKQFESDEAIASAKAGKTRPKEDG